MEQPDLLPKHIQDTKRMVEIIKAANEFKLAGVPVPPELIDEFNSLAALYSKPN